MAYLPNNLSLVTTTVEGVAPKMWTYASPDAIATVQGAGYVSNAVAAGMSLNDFVAVVDTTNSLRYFCAVTAISNGAATLGQKLTFA